MSNLFAGLEFNGRAVGRRRACDCIPDVRQIIGQSLTRFNSDFQIKSMISWQSVRRTYHLDDIQTNHLSIFGLNILIIITFFKK